MIIHVDMDAFYASVEIRDNPSLRGKPVVVGGSAKGRGVVSAASYEARQVGIHSAMSAASAIRLCPHAVFIRPRMEHYVAISRQIREVFFRFTSLVEPISLDEAFLDVSGCEGLFGPARSIAMQIKSTIQTELGLTASAGVAPNKFLAKVASDLQKPDGLVVVPPDGVQAFLDPLPIHRVWGIGPATERKFSSLGVHTIAGIRNIPRDVLNRRFGINSEHFWRLSRGIDSRPVVTEREARSISHETTFSNDIDEPDSLRAWVQELAGQVAMRLRKLKIRGKTVQLKVRFSDFRTITRRKTLPEYSFASRDIERVAKSLLEQVMESCSEPVRLVGVGVSNFNDGQPFQKTLFDQESRERMARIDQACDDLKEKFGSRIMTTGTALEQGIRLRRNPMTEDRKD